MNDILAVEVVDCLEDLSYGLGGILLCESALLANAVEQLSSSRKLSDDVVLVLPTVSVQPSLSRNKGCFCALSTRTNPQI